MEKQEIELKTNDELTPVILKIENLGDVHFKINPFGVELQIIDTHGNSLESFLISDSIFAGQYVDDVSRMIGCTVCASPEGQYNYLLRSYKNDVSIHTLAANIEGGNIPLACYPENKVEEIQFSTYETNGFSIQIPSLGFITITLENDNFVIKAFDKHLNVADELTVLCDIFIYDKTFFANNFKEKVSEIASSYVVNAVVDEKMIYHFYRKNLSPMNCVAKHFETNKPYVDELNLKPFVLKEGIKQPIFQYDPNFFINCKNKQLNSMKQFSVYQTGANELVSLFETFDGNSCLVALTEKQKDITLANRAFIQHISDNKKIPQDYKKSIEDIGFELVEISESKAKFKAAGQSESEVFLTVNFNTGKNFINANLNGEPDFGFFVYSFEEAIGTKLKELVRVGAEMGGDEHEELRRKTQNYFFEVCDNLDKLAKLFVS